MKRAGLSIAGLWGCLGMLLLANHATWAQVTRDGVITINGGKTTVFMKAPTLTAAPQEGLEPGLVIIYSNLGKGDHVYDAIAGMGILGPDTGQPWPESLAFALVPTKDRIVKKIQVGVTHVSGDNSVVLSLNKDNAGLPGRSLQHWRFVNLPVFGSCCTLQTAKSKQGIPVKKGKTYWVVLRPTAEGLDTWDVWNNDYNGTSGRFSNNLGDGWLDGGIQQQGAFGVFGQ
jgi:hypothetical protein